MLSGWSLPQHLSYALLGLDVVGFLLVRISARGITLFSEVDRTHALAGESVTERYRVDGGGNFSTALLSLVDETGVWHTFTPDGEDSLIIERTFPLPRRRTDRRLSRAPEDAGSGSCSGHAAGSTCPCRRAGSLGGSR